MTRDEARDHLEAGFHIYYESWAFNNSGITCEIGCCDEDYSSVEEVLNKLEEMGYVYDTQG